ncbi:single-stranded DNA-binding protein [Alicyclobacillus cycloheptanicus]|uniref:Single-stranded DNA-binding protein n=1 Tax=Alicyclobacillus cycloheptanicus TaxID=1457 RepID=A0ABT9XKW8_9BACL|nr:single-stranded DNA-binding protein [Alicyclobacillus cycloheptanicus]MDQ0190933.1 single-strand DNA-binding protein [Alicyclobacillus cycloheptanicus]WDM02383.1 single-stranded DNA-binding protein [Alicyclobacillus cycloheptanicus]
MLNRVILIGRLTQDPELRYTNSGTAVASFSLAVDRARPNQAGERETDFINIVVWQKQAELCAQYLHKGRLAAVDGRLQIRSYENREGQKVRVAEVVAETVRFLDRGDRTDNAFAQSAPASMPAGAPMSRPRPEPKTPQYDDDPFADDSQMIDISDDDLPF